MAASIVAEEDGLLASKGASAADNLSEEEGDTDVEMVLVSLQMWTNGMIWIIGFAKVREWITLLRCEVAIGSWYDYSLRI